MFSRLFISTLCLLCACGAVVKHVKSMQKVTGSNVYMHLFLLILKSERTGLYQYVLVYASMFLINRCMYWFVLVCTDSYHYVKLPHQYVQICTLLVCSFGIDKYVAENTRMYWYVPVCTCWYQKSIITFSSQYKEVPAVTLNPVP